MFVLFDNDVPRGLARTLIGHTVIEARERGWATFKNGEPPDVAELTGFDVAVTSAARRSGAYPDRCFIGRTRLSGRAMLIIV